MSLIGNVNDIMKMPLTSVLTEMTNTSHFQVPHKTIINTSKDFGLSNDDSVSDGSDEEMYLRLMIVRRRRKERMMTC